MVPVLGLESFGDFAVTLGRMRTGVRDRKILADKMLVPCIHDFPVINTL